MRRREAVRLLAGAAVASPAIVRAQPTRVPVIGYLHPGVQARGSVTMGALRTDLVEQGFVDGQTVRIVERWAEGKAERLRDGAREVVEAGADVVVAVGRAAVEAVLAVSRSVPVIIADLENDPVASGWGASIAKPGGNVTGLFLDAPAMCGKWLQQIADLVPNLGKVGVLWDVATGTYQRDGFLKAAAAASLQTALVEYRGQGAIETFVASSLAPDMQALVQLGSPLIYQSGGKIGEVLAARRMPSISPFRTFPTGGGLVSYGVDLIALYRRVSPLVARVLRGAKPADMPFEQPVKFELVLNLKAAKALGLAAPPRLLALADEVIE